MQDTIGSSSLFDSVQKTRLDAFVIILKKKLHFEGSLLQVWLARSTAAYPHVILNPDFLFIRGYSWERRAYARFSLGLMCLIRLSTKENKNLGSKLTGKHGSFEGIYPISFHNQIFRKNLSNISCRFIYF